MWCSFWVTFRGGKFNPIARPYTVKFNLLVPNAFIKHEQWNPTFPKTFSSARKLQLWINPPIKVFSTYHTEVLEG